MEKEVIIVTLGLIIGYLLFRAINRKQKSLTDVSSDMSELQSNSEHTQKSSISDDSKNFQSKRNQ